MEKIRVGVVGFGSMGRLYADALHTFPNAEVRAVADSNSKSAEEARRRYGCQVFGDYMSMLDAGIVDLAIITLPDFLHREAVIRAAERGLHILVEKPFATSLADADDMVAAIEKSGVKCMVEFFNRWSPPFAEAKKRVDAGELGEIVSVSAELNDTIFVPTRMLKWSARSSPAWFLMSHIADLAFWILSKKPKAVTAFGVRKLLAQRGIDTWDLVDAHLEYPDGSSGRLSNLWVLPEGMPIVYELTMRIVGSKASIDIDTSDQEIHLVTQERMSHPITAWGDILGQQVGHPYSMLRSMIESVETGAEPMVSHRDGYDNTKFIVAVHESLETGRKVALDW